jgi:molybdopterin-biosynthesis enzyme MoeA-like protein
MSEVKQFGVLIVGDEILRGKRTDKHLSHVINDLQAQGLQVAWSGVFGDDRKRLVRELKMTQLDSFA